MPGGVYIHIPFCRSRCSYCDFSTGLYYSDTASEYVDLLISEIQSSLIPTGCESVDTIYFGGGTPSLLLTSQVEAILKAVRKRFVVDESSEITMEMNPGTVTPEILCNFRQLGINRASFGAQSFKDEELRHLGRSHDSTQIYRTYELLRDAGFENINLDLIAGLPNQSFEVWSDNLAKAVGLKPEHVSFYLLEIHEGTPLQRQISAGMWPMPDEDLASEMFRATVERTNEAGYTHYEISNFCLPGYESRHNSKYWTGEPYIGFGCSAHSFDGKSRRWRNERSMESYMALLKNDRSPIVETTSLTESEAQSEAVFLRLRLMRGLDLTEHKERFGVDLISRHRSELDRLEEAGLIRVEADRLSLTTSGALLSNEVFTRLI
jgi:oxygen-independent coproporphyrinogen III oxidase